MRLGFAPYARLRLRGADQWVRPYVGLACVVEAGGDSIDRGA